MQKKWDSGGILHHWIRDCGLGCKRQDVYNSVSYGQMIQREYYAEVVDRPLSRKKDITLLLEYDRVRKEILERCK